MKHISWQSVLAASGLGLFASTYKMLLIPALLLVTCNVIDYITALIACKMQGKKWDSEIGIKGIFKKVLMWLLVIVGVVFDELIRYAGDVVGFDFKISFLVACIVAIWLILNELISILENIKTCGVKLPPFIEPLIKTTQEKIEKKGEEWKKKEE
jgi:toxin secretion/phage lysis holin